MQWTALPMGSSERELRMVAVLDVGLDQVLALTQQGPNPIR